MFIFYVYLSQGLENTKNKKIGWILNNAMGRFKTFSVSAWASRNIRITDYGSHYKGKEDGHKNKSVLLLSIIF